MKRIKRVGLVAALFLSLTASFAPPASADHVITMVITGTGVAPVDGGTLKVISWSCSAYTTAIPTMAMTITTCDATVTGSTTTNPGVAPVTYYGSAATTGGAAVISSTATEYEVCMTARVTRLLAVETTESKCGTIRIG